MAAGPSMAFLCVAVFPIVAVVIAVILFIRQRTRPRIEHPQCGKCGYRVEGLEALRCPECGSDLRLVGIVTPKLTGRVPPIVWALLWTVILPLPAMFISALVGRSLPTRLTNETVLTVTPTNPGAGYTQIACVLAGEGATPNAFDAGELRLSKADANPPATLDFRVESDALTIDRGTPGGPPKFQPLTAEIVAGWLASQTNRTDQDQLLNEARALLTHLGDAQHSRGISTNADSPFGSAGVTVSSRFLPHRWFGPTAIVFWLGVWLFVVVWIFRRESKYAALDSKPA